MVLKNDICKSHIRIQPRLFSSKYIHRKHPSPEINTGLRLWFIEMAIPFEPGQNKTLIGSSYHPLALKLPVFLH